MIFAIARGARAIGIVLICAVALAGCVQKRMPLEGSLADSSKTGVDPLSEIVVPLVVRSVDISTVDNQHAVFFKLSRVPNGVRGIGEGKPARVVVEVDGPSTGEDLAPESYPGADTLVNRITMSRTNGHLQLVLDLNAEEPPDYRVVQMADYVVVRFNVAR